MGIVDEGWMDGCDGWEKEKGGRMEERRGERRTGQAKPRQDRTHTLTENTGREGGREKRLQRREKGEREREREREKREREKETIIRHIIRLNVIIRHCHHC